MIVPGSVAKSTRIQSSSRP